MCFFEITIPIQFNYALDTMTPITGVEFLNFHAVTTPVVISLTVTDKFLTPFGFFCYLIAVYTF